MEMFDLNLTPIQLAIFDNDQNHEMSIADLEIESFNRYNGEEANQFHQIDNNVVANVDQIEQIDIGDMFYIEEFNNNQQQQLQQPQQPGFTLEHATSLHIHE